MHLEGQLAGGTRMMRAGARGAACARDAGHHGQAEGERLAGAGLAAAEHVGPASMSGMVARWMGNGLVDALAGQARHERLGQAEQRELGRAGASRGAVRAGRSSMVTKFVPFVEKSERGHVTSAKGRAGTYGMRPYTMRDADPHGGAAARVMAHRAEQPAAGGARRANEAVTVSVACQRGADTVPSRV